MIIIRSAPVFWGVETEPVDPSFLTRSWLAEDQIPYRESTWAFRIRVSHKHWLHVGLFRYRREALHSGLAFRPTDIGSWGRDAVQADQIEAEAAGEHGEHEPGRDEAVTAALSGLGDGVGDELAEHVGPLPQAGEH